MLVEADCNGAAMSEALRELAVAVRARHGVDRTLDQVDYDLISARGRLGSRAP